MFVDFIETMLDVFSGQTPQCTGWSELLLLVLALSIFFKEQLFKVRPRSQEENTKTYNIERKISCTPDKDICLFHLYRLSPIFRCPWSSKFHGLVKK